VVLIFSTKCSFSPGYAAPDGSGKDEKETGDFPENGHCVFSDGTENNAKIKT
jgi:hypothetical protein